MSICHVTPLQLERFEKTYNEERKLVYKTCKPILKAIKQTGNRFETEEYKLDSIQHLSDSTYQALMFIALGDDVSVYFHRTSSGFYTIQMEASITNTWEDCISNDPDLNYPVLSSTSIMSRLAAALRRYFNEKHKEKKLSKMNLPREVFDVKLRPYSTELAITTKTGITKVHLVAAIKIPGYTLQWFKTHYGVLPSYAVVDRSVLPYKNPEFSWRISFQEDEETALLRLKLRKTVNILLNSFKYHDLLRKIPRDVTQNVVLAINRNYPKHQTFKNSDISSLEDVLFDLKLAHQECKLFHVFETDYNMLREMNRMEGKRISSSIGHVLRTIKQTNK